MEPNTQNLTTSNFDMVRLSSLVEQIISGRSITKFVEESGLSRTFISRLLNKKLLAPPKVSTLEKLALPPVNSSNVSLNDLMQACGYGKNGITNNSQTRGPQSYFKNFGDSVAYYFSPNPALAMSIFMNALSDLDRSAVYSIQWQACGNFSVDLDGKQQGVVLPAFCPDINSQRSLLVSILQRLFLLTKEFPSHYYYIVTDSPDFYLILAKEMVPFSLYLPISLLLTDSQHQNFIKQDFILNDQNKSGSYAEPFVFLPTQK